MQLRRVLARGTEHVGDHLRGVRLGELADELDAVGTGQLVEQLGEDGADRRAICLGSARRQRRVDQTAQAAVILAVAGDEIL